LHTEKGKGPFASTLGIPEVLGFQIYIARFPELRFSLMLDLIFVKKLMGSIGGVSMLLSHPLMQFMTSAPCRFSLQFSPTNFMLWWRFALLGIGMIPGRNGGERRKHNWYMKFGLMN